MRTKGKLLMGAVLLLLAAVLILSALFIRQTREIVKLQERAAILDGLCAAAGEEPLGYANESFRSNRSVVIMNCGETEKLKLTANWKNGGKVYVDCSSDAAELSFQEENWEQYTTMEIRAVHPGVTVASFSSDATDRRFAVWILVE